MTDVPSKEIPLSRTREIKARAAAWLERKDSGAWTDKDQAELDTWLAEATTNLIAYRRVADVWGRTERLVALRPPSRNYGPAAPATKSAPRLIKASMGIAAAALLGIVAASTWRSPEGQTYTTAVGGRDILTLPDGSRIELNTDTSVRVSDSGNVRQVWLDRGEAYFQIVHNASRPFIVTAGDHRVTDIGTKFMMRRDSSRIQVAVVDGKVQFETDGDERRARQAVLGAGDTVTATADAVVINRKSTTDLTTELSWRQGVFVFRRTTLEDAAHEYNRYNQQKITITDRKIAELTLSGTLPTNNIEAFIGVARSFFSLDVERHNGQILLSRAPENARPKQAN